MERYSRYRACQRKVSSKRLHRCRGNSHRKSSCSDRKSTRLNSSHSQISYAVFCLKKKTALVHSGLTAAAWRWRPTPLVDCWLDLGSAGVLFFSILSALFPIAAIYGVGYLASVRQV